MGTLALIIAMLSTEVLVVNDFQQHQPHTKPIPNLIFECRNFFKMNEYMGNVSRCDKEYHVLPPADKEQNL